LRLDLNGTAGIKALLPQPLKGEQTTIPQIAGKISFYPQKRRKQSLSCKQQGDSPARCEGFAVASAAFPLEVPSWPAQRSR
jgi:hypothetical protein